MVHNNFKALAEKANHLRKAFFLITAAVLILGCLACFLGPVLMPGSAWISDLGYEKGEVYPLTFNWDDERSCPQIPVRAGGSEYAPLFDTGCGIGMLLTNVVEDSIPHTFLEQTEALNRDGSHQGWIKRVVVEELDIFGDTYKSVKANIADWTMFASQPFDGNVGLAYFQKRTVTLDYAGHKIAVSRNPIDYTSLDPDKYTVLSLYRSTSRGQGDLLFFPVELDGKLAMAYLDTGKNYSYVYDPECGLSIMERPPSGLKNVSLKLGGKEIMLKDVAQVNDLPQAQGLPYPTMVELNSDQIWKCKLIVTIDLIDQKIIFR